MLKAAEFAPHPMEFPGHAQKLHAQSPGICRRQRKMIVAPHAGGQTLQLQMGVGMRQIPPAPVEVAGVVEEGRPGVIAMHRPFHALRIPPIDPLRLALYIRRIQRIQSGAAHLRQTAVAVAGAYSGNIQKNAAGAIPLHDLLHLRCQPLQIGSVIAQQVIARHQKILPLPGGRAKDILRMLPGIVFVPTGGHIYRRPHADLGARLQLRPQQIKGQPGVLHAHRRGMIGIPVMAFGKQGDGVHMTQPQRPLKLRLIESAADAGDFTAGVKVQMHLPIAHFLHSRPFRLRPELLQVSGALF